MQQVSTKASKQFITTNDLRRMGVTVVSRIKIWSVHVKIKNGVAQTQF